MPGFLVRFWRWFTEIDTAVSLAERVLSVGSMMALIGGGAVWLVSDLARAALAALAVIVVVLVSLFFFWTWHRQNGLKEKELGLVTLLSFVSILILSGAVLYFAAKDAGYLAFIGEPPPPWGDDPLNPPPDIIGGWGVQPNDVHLEVNTETLLAYKKRYRFLMVIRPADSAIDWTDDPNVEFSDAREIIAPLIAVTIVPSDQFKIKSLQSGRVDIYPCLVPYDRKPTFKTIRDLVESGGGVLDQTSVPIVGFAVSREAARNTGDQSRDLNERPKEEGQSRQ